MESVDDTRVVGACVVGAWTDVHRLPQDTNIGRVRSGMAPQQRLSPHHVVVNPCLWHSPAVFYSGKEGLLCFSCPDSVMLWKLGKVVWTAAF